MQNSSERDLRKTLGLGFGVAKPNLTFLQEKHVDLRLWLRLYAFRKSAHPSEELLSQHGQIA